MDKFGDISTRLTSAIQVQTIVVVKIKIKITTGRPVRRKKRTDYMQGDVHLSRLLVVVYTGLAAGIGRGRSLVYF